MVDKKLAGSSQTLNSPPVVGRGIQPTGAWFDAHGFHTDVEKAWSTIENLRSLYYEDGQEVGTGPEGGFKLGRPEQG